MTRLGPTRLRILALVLANQGRPPTVHGISRAIRKSVQCVHHHLLALRLASFLTWEEGRHGTIRPTCRFIPADELEETP